MEYRIVETIGRFWNKRWELQEKYSYWQNGNKVESWHMVCCGTKEFCEEALQRHIENEEEYRLKREAIRKANWEFALSL